MLLMSTQKKKVSVSGQSHVHIPCAEGPYFLRVFVRRQAANAWQFHFWVICGYTVTLRLPQWNKLSMVIPVIRGSIHAHKRRAPFFCITQSA